MIEPNTQDRILESLRALIRAEFPRLAFAGLFDYEIQAVNGSPPNVLIDCKPNDETLGLPALVGVKMQPSVAGITTTPSAGQNCVVSFLDSNPSKPIIVGVDSLGVNPVARLGDQVTVFLPATLPVQGVGTLTGPFVGTMAVANPITGIISQGSGIVFTG